MSAHLTKRQKKGLAFRGRFRSKHSPSPAVPLSLPDTADASIMEDQAVVEGEPDGIEEEDGEGDKRVEGLVLGSDPVRRKGIRPPKRKRKEREQDDAHIEAKRKRPKKGLAALDTDLAQHRQRKQVEQGKGLQEKGSQALTAKPGPGHEQKQRFILFVGNLKYTTSIESVKAHFSSCDPPPTVRLLTPRAKPSTPISASTPKSKGFAFLEFTSRGPLQQALKLHHSELEGRKINVELTAGGGGKSESRLNKLKKRNKELYGQMHKRLEKSSPSDSSVQQARPQRYSATSGIEQAPTTQRTWTVGDIDDGKAHRGGQKHAKRNGRSKKKDWATGVNTIPVG